MNQHAAGRWRPLDRSRLGRLPDWLQPWLADEGSLTTRLQQRYSGRLLVQPLPAARRMLRQDEARLLKLRTGRRVRVREVLLCVDGRARVYARSLLPDRCLRGRTWPLTRLGTRPLGGWLFAQRDLLRDHIELARVPLPATLAQDAATAGAGHAWARRSRFRVGGATLLVTEAFLADLERP
jgi:chorismate lyase